MAKGAGGECRRRQGASRPGFVELGRWGKRGGKGEGEDMLKGVGGAKGLARCGGINPYTLTARLGPGGLAHYETNSKA